MHLKTKLSLLGFALTMTGCTDDYTPPANATGRTIYLEACARCHTGEKGAEDMYWTINLKNDNEKYIAYKVNVGGLTMPAFPNITKANMRKLTAFVLEHSLRK